jgi:hypothetical protein
VLLSDDCQMTTIKERTIFPLGFQFHLPEHSADFRIHLGQTAAVKFVMNRNPAMRRCEALGSPFFRPSHEPTSYSYQLGIISRILTSPEVQPFTHH